MALHPHVYNANIHSFPGTSQSRQHRYDHFFSFFGNLRDFSWSIVRFCLKNNVIEDKDRVLSAVSVRLLRICWHEIRLEYSRQLEPNIHRGISPEVYLNSLARPQISI